MKRRTARYLLVLAALAAVGAGAYLFLLMRPLAVEVVRPVANAPMQVFGLGTVEARVLSDIGFEVGGALVELNADHGDDVHEGAVLARLHSAEQMIRVAMALAGVANAEAQLKMAEAAVGKARAVLARREQANERKQALLDRQTVSVEAAEEAQLEVDVASAELAVALSAVDVARSTVEDARAQYEFEKVRLEHHALKAPYDAVVVQRHKELGTVLGLGETLFTLVAPQTVWALAYVDESRAGDIRIDQPAEVHLRSLPRLAFRGHVTRIDIESDRLSEERRVYISCDQCPESFHLGEQAEVFITVAVLDRALLVPETAVDGFDGHRGTVWTVEDGELRRREVTFGYRTLDSRLELVAGLPENAQVVGVPRPGLREGRAATVLGDTAP